MTNKQQRFFDIADKVSELSNHQRAKLGCIVVEHGRVISSGHNSGSKSHPLQKKLDRIRFDAESTGKVHAEVSALLPLVNSKADLSKATIYVSRRLKDGTLALARPCASCMTLIKACNIRCVCYTTKDGYAIEKIV